jgi:predicted nuclease of predicted toxin-antitoxin system
MRLLADQDIYAVTVTFLRSHGHDVATVSDVGLSQSDDLVVLQTAIQDRRILITRDRDFGGIVIAGTLQGGVIYLRVVHSALKAVHGELLRVLSQYAEDVLLKSLVVVEEGRHRIRRLQA